MSQIHAVHDDESWTFHSASKKTCRGNAKTKYELYKVTLTERMVKFRDEF